MAVEGCFLVIWAPKALSLFTAITSLAMAVPTTIGNGLIVIAVVCDPLKRLQNPFNYFLVNLAVSDLLVGLIALPISFWCHLGESEGAFPDNSIPALHLSVFMSSTASLLSLVALSVDRYIMITNAVKYRRYMNWKHCLKVSLFIWFLSFTVPLVYFKTGYIGYLMVHEHTMVLAAAIILALNYYYIYKFLRQRTLSTQDDNTGRRTSVHTKNLLVEQKVTCTLLVMLVAFLATAMPAVIMTYVLHFCKSCNCTLRQWLRDLNFLLFPTCSAINPFICIIRLKPFRKAIKKMGSQICAPGKVRSDTATSASSLNNIQVSLSK